MPVPPDFMRTRSAVRRSLGRASPTPRGERPGLRHHPTFSDPGYAGRMETTRCSRSVRFPRAFALPLVPLVLGALPASARQGITQRVSVDSAGGQGNGASNSCVISADGRYVAFASMATNLVAGDTNNTLDVFVRDRQPGTTELVSLDSSGAQANGNSGETLAISADGRCVAFTSFADNLVAGDANLFADVFVRDRQLGTTERVSVDSGGGEAKGDS